MAKSAYKRILLKVSGEVLAGDQSFGIEPKFLHQMADQIAEVATYIRASWGNNAPAVTAAEVKALRERTDPSTDHVIVLQMR